jgi:hypothetical protein
MSTLLPVGLVMATVFNGTLDVLPVPAHSRLSVYCSSIRPLHTTPQYWLAVLRGP